MEVKFEPLVMLQLPELSKIMLKIKENNVFNILGSVAKTSE
jgi:hypothetical protein